MPLDTMSSYFKIFLKKIFSRLTGFFQPFDNTASVTGTIYRLHTRLEWFALSQQDTGMN